MANLRIPISGAKRGNHASLQAALIWEFSSDASFHQAYRSSKAGSKLRVRNSKLAGGLESAVLGHNNEKSARCLGQARRDKSMSIPGSATSMMKGPTDSPAREQVGIALIAVRRTNDADRNDECRRRNEHDIREAAAYKASCK